MKKFIAILPILLLLSCQGTKIQQVEFTTTDAIGKAVEDVTKSFSDYTVVKAKASLPPSPSLEALMNKAATDPDWLKFSDLHGKFLAAYALWCNGNALAASGTNAASVLGDPQFRANALSAALELTAFVATFTPTGKAGQTIYKAR